MALAGAEPDVYPPQIPQSDGHSPTSQRPPSRAASISTIASNQSDRHEVMSRYLYKKARQLGWLDLGENAQMSDLGVVLRRAEGEVSCEPQHIYPPVVRFVETMNLPVAFTMASQITDSLIASLPPLQRELRVESAGLAVPIIANLEEALKDPSLVARDAYMCICKQENFLLLWSDSVQSLLAHATHVETILISLVWGAPINPPQAYSNHSPHLTPRFMSGAMSPDPGSFMQSGHPGSSPSLRHTPVDSILCEKIAAVQAAIELEDMGEKAYDPEKDGVEAPKRPFLITHAAIIGVSVMLVVIVELACVAKLIQESLYDGQYLRWALLATIPIFSSFSLFFMIVIAGSVYQLFGPLTGLNTNSTYFSAKAPKPGRYPNLELPHITIQMPVFLEGLKGVIIPTCSSVIAAVKHYEELGGTATIYVNDDGMQHPNVSVELKEARKAFYELNHIGWCSRPAQSMKEDNYFIRKGKFKKASNMNYCLDFSMRVEEEFVKMMDIVCIARDCSVESLTVDEENEIYGQARDKVCENDGGRTLAAGDVRIGEIILIIDSDTRVPKDCLLYGALEMHESPELALLQHASGILQVVNNTFENGITYFTNLIYNSIQFAVGNGDLAPFVGHNTFIRWKAIQSIAFTDDDDGRTKFWSEDHVSEDFDVSLRLQMQGFVTRLATYHNGGFKEGVSLTVFDELARWEKYAYGCNELVFNPLVKWPMRGPFTKLFMRFLWSNIKITSKVTILAYIFTYYAIASAVPLTLANYLLVGWCAGSIDQFYIDSWKIFVGMAAVFNVLSPLSYAMLRHRLGQKTFFWSVVETIKWTPMFLLFFGGLSFHLSRAIACHFLSLKIEWTATAKELEDRGFRVGLDRVFRNFRWMYLFFVIPLTVGMVYLAFHAPYGWTITDFAAIIPIANQVGCHALLPFALGLF